MIIIFTYQMVGIADQNGRTYESKYGTYNKKNGFVLSSFSRSMTKQELLNKTMHEDCWSLKIKEKEMTKEEIEKILGYKIKIKNDVDTKDINIKDYNPNKNINCKRIPQGLFNDDDIWSFIFK